MLRWKELYTTCLECERCRLSSTRTQVVFGEGNLHAPVVFIGEGPGADEDRLGRPFVGRAGQLLEKGLRALGWDRNDVYIANVVKCRPPGNRVPEAEEADACLPWLRNQIALIRPKIIVCLGATAAKAVVDAEIRITRDRGIWKEKNGVWILPTFHPAALLRDESKKRLFWEDLQALYQKYQQVKETDL